jgi:hypothetical protein
MKTYISNKLVQATPMSKHTFVFYTLIGQTTIPHEDDEEGFLVEDTKGVSNHKEHKGRIHWLSYPEFLADHVSLGDISDSPEYQQRMVGELAQLNVRLADLQKYLKSDRFLKLDFIDRDLLQEQCRMMARYSGVLTDRLLRCGF